MTDFQYFEYLKTRSSISVLYREILLYPLLIKKSKGKILDYGCGIGDFLTFKKDAIGVDINNFCIEFCKEKNLNAFHTSQLDSLFNNNSFDTVILDNVYEHIEEPSTVIPTIKRILSKNGLLIIGVPGIKGYTSDATHKVFYSECNLTNSLEKFGFKKDYFFYSPFMKSNFLSKHMKTYVTWGVFSKTV